MKGNTEEKIPRVPGIGIKCAAERRKELITVGNLYEKVKQEW